MRQIDTLSFIWRYFPDFKPSFLRRVFECNVDDRSRAEVYAEQRELYVQRNGLCKAIINFIHTVWFIRYESLKWKSTVLFTGHRKLAELISVQKEFENEISLDEKFLEAYRIFHEFIFVQAGLQINTFISGSISLANKPPLKTLLSIILESVIYLNLNL